MKIAINSVFCMLIIVSEATGKYLLDYNISIEVFIARLMSEYVFATWHFLIFAQCRAGT